MQKKRKMRTTKDEPRKVYKLILHENFEEVIF